MGQRAGEGLVGMEALPRLSPATLDRLPPDVARPAYGRAALPVRMAHLGVGAFHRCHQADFLEDLAQGPDGVGVVGINLQPPDLGATLAPQQGLYARTLRDGDHAETRVIGTLVRTADAGRDTGAAIRWLADPRIAAVTLTVTEKGYCHVPATGRLDEGHPGILADLVALQGAGGALRSMPGLVVAGLAARRAAGGGPVTLLSCDNIAGNGRVLRGVVRRMAGGVPGLVGWIDDHVGFPSSMVDRIVPATTDADRDWVALRLGVLDAAPVMGEPFRQWVVEDDLRAGMPALASVGVGVVADVTAHEHVKMRVLNAAQTMLALTGALRGHRHTHDAVADAGLAGFVRDTLARETLPHLPVVAGMEGRPYLARAMDRIANRAICHTCHQIATDTSQKIRQRVLDPLRELRGRGLAAPGLETALAAWVAYLAAGLAGRWGVSDPVAGRLPRMSDVAGFTAGVLGLADVFGDLARDAALAGRLVPVVQALLHEGPQSTGRLPGVV